MDKRMKVLMMVVCLFAVATAGFVNATPRPLKEANMVYWTSLDPKELPVPGNQVSDFKLTLDGNPDTWYYLDIKFIRPILQEFPSPGDAWFLTAPPAEDTAFWEYWDAKGVNSAAPYKTGTPPVVNWKWVMWRIIRPWQEGMIRFPMFHLASDGQGNYMLVDGLQYWVSYLATGGKGPFGINPLRLNGDYPKGIYTFTCDLEIHEPADFVVEMSIMFR